tara:strand:- start:963 stop:1391 length:429 start_codon:yes stop_codon:yes gene_type:complete
MSEMPCKIGFTCGSFDLLHAGHVLMLEEARRECDHLIVAIQTDPTIDRPTKNSPVQTLEERKTVLRGIRWVDEIRVYKTEEDLWNMLSYMAPDVRILGADWKGKDYTGHDLGHTVFFNSRNHTWSSAELRRRVYEAELKKRT